MKNEAGAPALTPSDDVEEVTARQAAKILKVAQATLKKLDIPYRQYQAGGRCHYRLADLHRYIEKHSYNL